MNTWKSEKCLPNSGKLVNDIPMQTSDRKIVWKVKILLKLLPQSNKCILLEELTCDIEHYHQVFLPLIIKII